MRHALVLLTLLALRGTWLFAQGSWVEQSSPTTDHLLGVDFINANTGWIVGDTGTVLKTTNGGTTWMALSSGTTQRLSSVDFVDASTGWATGGDTYGLILKTTNGGTSWVRQDSTGILEAIQFVSGTTGWAVGIDGLILKTTNGGATWIDQSDPLVDSWLKTLSFVDSTTGWVAGVIPGIVVKTTDGGSSWTTQTNGIDGTEDYYGISFPDRQTGWLVGYGVQDTNSIGVIRRTTDGGSTWVAQSSALDQVLTSTFFTGLSEGWVVGGAGTILHTSDRGSSWSLQSSGNAGELDHIVVVGSQGGWIAGYGGVILHNSFAAGGVTDTLDLRAGWNIVSIPLTVTDNRKTTLFPTAASRAFQYDNGTGYLPADSLKPGRGYWLKYSVGTQVLITGDALTNLTLNLKSGWNLIGGINADIPFGSVVQTPAVSVAPPFGYTDSYFIATTIQRGKGYWMRAVRDCQVAFESALHPVIHPEYMAAGAQIGSDILPPPPPDGPTTGPEVNTLPTQFMLQQNYPNPFNPATELRFDVRDVSQVTLKIFDLFGREIITLVNEVRAPGRYSATWDAARLPSGVYFARMTASGAQSYQATRKLVLMR